MSNRDLGGPAFPNVEVSQHHFGQPDGYMGLSARDYFAARAPADIPDWFQIENDTPMPKRLDRRAALHEVAPELEVEVRNSILNWMSDPCFDMDVAARQEIGDRAFAAMENREAEISAWLNRRQARRYFAWRWHYADQMLLERAK